MSPVIFHFFCELLKKLQICRLYSIYAVTIVDVRFSLVFPSTAKSTYNTWYQTKINDTTRSAIKICIWCDKNSLIFARYFNFNSEKHKKIRFCGLYCICAVTIVDVRFSMIFPSNAKFTYNTWYQTKINDTTRSAIKICIWRDKNSPIFCQIF